MGNAKPVIGGLTKMLKIIQKMTNKELLSRYQEVISNRAVREYVSVKNSKEDRLLSVEIRLITEDIMRRITIAKPSIAIGLG